MQQKEAKGLNKDFYSQKMNRDREVNYRFNQQVQEEANQIDQ